MKGRMSANRSPSMLSPTVPASGAAEGTCPERCSKSQMYRLRGVERLLVSGENPELITPERSDVMRIRHYFEGQVLSDRVP